MTRTAFVFGLFCFIIGLAIGVLVTLYLVPTTPKYQDAQAALILASAKVKEAEAERLKIDARADELALQQTVRVKVIGAWVNVFAIPGAAVVVALACFFALRRHPLPAPVVPVGVLPATALGFDRDQVDPTLVWVRHSQTDRAKRDLQDVREFIERGAVNGFARADWVGRDIRFTSGHKCTRTRYEALIEAGLKANVLQVKGNSHELACSVADALDCFSDGENDE